MKSCIRAGLLSVCISMLASFAALAAERVIDLGQVEIEGELRRPQVRWVDSSKRMKDLLPRIHSERFQAIEKKLLKPLTVAQASAWIKKRSGKQ